MACLMGSSTHKKTFLFEISTKVSAERARLWNHMTNMESINFELMPLIKMTYPSERSHISGANLVPVDETLFMSVILLFGLLPIDLHWLKLDKIVDGYSFAENSTTLLHLFWRHTRTLEVVNDETTTTKMIVKDEVEFCPRVGFLGFVILPIVKYVFQHRHLQLRKLFC
jgi:ligand-binding SRPBCC domain-containing protein